MTEAVQATTLRGCRVFIVTAPVTSWSSEIHVGNMENKDRKEIIGPSGVRALPLGVAAEQSVHYFWDYFSFLSVPHTFLQEGVVLGL